MFFSVCFIFLSSELYAWEKESGIIKSKDGSICRVYKDWILKFDLKKTIEEPEGGPGSRIAIIKRGVEVPEISCKSSKVLSVKAMSQHLDLDVFYWKRLN